MSKNESKWKLSNTPETGNGRSFTNPEVNFLVTE